MTCNSCQNSGAHKSIVSNHVAIGCSDKNCAACGRIEEYDWDGNLVWQFDYSASQYTQHHDIKPLPNGNILMLVVEKKTYEEAIAAGFNPSRFQSQVQAQGCMLPDSVVEIKPTRPSGGTVVWSWHVWDHLIQDYAPTAGCWTLCRLSSAQTQGGA